MSRALVACLFAGFLALSPLGAVSAQSQSQSQLQLHQAGALREKVFLLRGFTNVLSPGIDQLARELKDKNVETEVANHMFALSLAKEAIDDCKSGRVGRIVLIGHSFGATGARMRPGS